MAGALTILLWGTERFKDGYVAANQLDAMYDTVKWALDYLLDAWDPFTQQLVVQVRSGEYAFTLNTATRGTGQIRRTCIYPQHSDPWYRSDPANMHLP